MIADNIDRFTPDECKNHFQAAGYDPDSIESALIQDVQRNDGDHLLIVGDDAAQQAGVSIAAGLRHRADIARRDDENAGKGLGPRA